MSITVTGDTIHDVRSKIGMGSKPNAIRISFPNSAFDFGRIPEYTCIIDATDFNRNEVVPRSFDSSAKAIQYLKGILKKRDKWVAQEKKKLSKKSNGKTRV